MNIFHMGARILSRSSPVLLLAGGAALVLTLPPVRSGLRAALVTATKGALIVSDGVKNLSEQVRAGASDIVVEARQTSCCPCSKIKSLQSSARVRGRRMAVATTAGILNMKDKAKSVQAEFQGIVDEARQFRDEKKSDADVTQEIVGDASEEEVHHDGLEASITDIGADATRKRRSAFKKVTE